MDGKCDCGEDLNEYGVPVCGLCETFKSTFLVDIVLPAYLKDSLYSKVTSEAESLHNEFISRHIKRGDPLRSIKLAFVYICAIKNKILIRKSELASLNRLQDRNIGSAFKEIGTDVSCKFDPFDLIPTYECIINAHMLRLRHKFPDIADVTAESLDFHEKLHNTQEFSRFHANTKCAGVIYYILNTKGWDISKDGDFISVVNVTQQTMIKFLSAVKDCVSRHIEWGLPWEFSY